MKRLSGFTLTELLIAMMLGLILLSMAITAFSAVSKSTRQAQQLAELQQNAQLLISLFHNELANVGFWGGRSAPAMATTFALPILPVGDCLEPALDSGSFPSQDQHFVTLYAQFVNGGRQLNCLPEPLPQTEFLQVKRLIGLQTPIAEMRQNRFYLETQWQHSRFVSSDSAGLSEHFHYFPYQHLVFYLQQQRVDGDVIPVLMRKRLSRNQAGMAVISTDSILDGVERMHFEFGIDSDADGQLNYQLATTEVPAAAWQQQGVRIISLKYYVILRARKPDPSYVNEQQYDMGQFQFVAPGDHYRRMLVSSSIFFQNNAL